MTLKPVVHSHWGPWGGETMGETEKGPDLGSCVICSISS